MRNFIVTFFVIILLSNNSFAEMKNTKILNSIFNGCIGNSQQVDGKKYIYCGCYTTKLAQKFTFDEFLNMSVDFRHLSKKEMQKEFLKNPKITSSINECIGYL